MNSEDLKAFDLKLEKQEDRDKYGTDAWLRRFDSNGGAGEGRGRAGERLRG